jgi:hypothetical protein
LKFASTQNKVAMKTKTIDKTGFQFSKTDIIPLLIWATVFFMTWLFMHGADHFLQMTPEALGKYFKLR